MFDLVPYKREHLIPLLDQRENLSVKELFISGTAESLEKSDAFTLLVNGVPSVCGGVLRYWEGRGQIWCVFNEDFRHNFVPVFRGIKVYLSEQLKTYRRIEASIPIDFPKGRRRIEMLGFKLECELAEKFLPDGRSCSLYALVRE